MSTTTAPTEVELRALRDVHEKNGRDRRVSPSPSVERALMRCAKKGLCVRNVPSATGWALTEPGLSFVSSSEVHPPHPESLSKLDRIDELSMIVHAGFLRKLRALVSTSRALDATLTDLPTQGLVGFCKGRAIEANRFRDSIRSLGVDDVEMERVASAIEWSLTEIVSQRARLDELSERSVEELRKRNAELSETADEKGRRILRDLSERRVDDGQMPPAARRGATERPSLPVAFRSRLYVEVEHWSAHVKVDYDDPAVVGGVEKRNNPLDLARIARAAKKPYLYLSADRIDRALVHRTKKGHHLRIWFRPELPRLPASVILAIQEALGDDATRVKMNELRVERDEAGWNCLWNVKTVNGRTTSCEVLDAALTERVSRILRGGD